MPGIDLHPSEAFAVVGVLLCLWFLVLRLTHRLARRPCPAWAAWLIRVGAPLVLVGWVMNLAGW